MSPAKMYSHPFAFLSVALSHLHSLYGLVPPPHTSPRRAHISYFGCTVSVTYHHTFSPVHFASRSRTLELLLLGGQYQRLRRLRARCDGAPTVLGVPGHDPQSANAAPPNPAVKMRVH